MKPLTLFFLFIYITIQTATAQVKYYKKVEAGYFINRGGGVKYDIDDPNWKGPPLKNEPNAANLSFINGVGFFGNKLLTGAGLGYLNFQGIHGLSLVSEIEYMPVNESGGPFVNVRLGYTHIWSVYENGTGSEFIDIEGGIKLDLYKELDMYIKSGFIYTQNYMFVPVSLGVQF